MDKAKAEYEAAKAKCETLEDELNELCEARAKAQHVKADADAKGVRAAELAGIAAGEVKRKADYDVAIVRCRSMFPGDARRACVARAQLELGQ